MAETPRFAEMQQRAKDHEDRIAAFRDQVAIMPEVEEAEKAVSGERRGLLADAGVGVTRAIPGAFEEAFDLIGSLDEAMISTVVDLSHSVGIPDLRLGDDPRTDEVEGFFNGFSLSREESEQFPLGSLARVPESGLGQIKDLVPEPERLTGQIAEPITKFIVGFVSGKRALQAGGLLQGTSRAAGFANATAAGVVADAAVFDGHEARLSNMVESVPALSNPLTAWLAADDEDGELEGRLKSAVEGAGLGALFESLMIGFRGIKQARLNRAIAAATKKADETVLEIPADAGPTAVPRVDVTDDAVDIAVEGGNLKAIPRGGETLQVVNSGVTESARGTGKGTELYAAAARQADDMGLRLTSDTSVSEDAARVWEGLAKRGDEIIDQRVTNPDNVIKENLDGTINYETKNGTPLFERVGKKADDAAAPKTEAEVIEVRKAETRSRIRETMSITKEQQAAFQKAVSEGDDDAAVEVLKDFNENTIDWTKIEDASDIKAVLLETERMFADLVTDAKGGVQSNAQTKRLANLVNASASEVGRLFRDTRGGGGIAARFYAAHRTMLASAQEVKRAAQASLDNPASGKHEAAALRALQVHAAVQAEVKGAQTEIARALQGMKMIKDAAADNYREFDELRQQFAGQGKGRSTWERQMDDILKDRSLDELNRRVNRTTGEKLKDVFFEYTINSMLSSPKTHVINLVSNVLNTVIYAGDRTLGGTYRYLAKGDKAALREARIDVASKLFQMDEAFQLARKAWRDGAPVTDHRQRLEFKQRQAIEIDGTSRPAVEGDEALPELGSNILARKSEVVKDDLGNAVSVVEHNPFQRAINTLGRTIRVPGRALITGDEFFKAVNRNAEINVLAFRKADDEAIAAGMEYGSKQYEKFVAKRSKDLTADARLDRPNSLDGQRLQETARDKSRLTTFQETAKTKFGKASENWINSNQLFKLVVAPFFRTPMNIIRQGAFDRTPLGYLLTDTQDALRHAHPREQAEIVARMMTGVAAMSGFAAFMDGPDGEGNLSIVGTVPQGSSAKAAGVQDYSIRLGDTWYQFNRLEPLGMWLGMIADFKTSSVYARDDEVALFTLAQGALGAFLNNVTSKTFFESFSGLYELFEGVSGGKPATVNRAVARFAAGEFGKLIPQFVKASAAGLEGDGDRFARESWGVVDTMMTRSSLFHSTEPYKHDSLGFPIEKDAGLSILLNPFAVSRDKLDDPVYAAMFDLGFTLQPVPKSLGAGEVELTSDQYSDLTSAMRDTKTYEALTALVSSDAWPEMAPALQTALMKKLINTGRKTAREIFLGRNPDIIKKAAQSKVDAAFLLTSDAE